MARMMDDGLWIVRFTRAVGGSHCMGVEKAPLASLGALFRKLVIYHVAVV